jgi:hypothetical protein
VRDALASSVKTWLKAVHRAVTQARDEGHLAADLDANQMVFEIHGLILALHYEARFLKSAQSFARASLGFENILQRYGALPLPITPAAKSTKPAEAKAKKSKTSR